MFVKSTLKKGTNKVATTTFQALSDEIENLKTVNIQQDLTIKRLLTFIGQDIGESFNARIIRLYIGKSCGQRQTDTT